VEALVVLVVVGTSVWVFVDAPGRGLSRWWAGGCLALWIVAFPWYVVTRRGGPVPAGARPQAGHHPAGRCDPARSRAGVLASAAA
jgi:hypothetical protein